MVDYIGVEEERGSDQGPGGRRQQASGRRASGQVGGGRRRQAHRRRRLPPRALGLGPGLRHAVGGLADGVCRGAALRKAVGSWGLAALL